MQGNGFDRYREFFLKEPERIIHWQDEELGAEGWLVMNSLTGGAAGGGTRMRPGANQEEAVFLAKTMEIKFRVCGPDQGIGGGKSVIRFDPTDPRKPEALKRWFRHIGNELRTCYGTGGDQNVNEDEVCDLSKEAIGLSHPQEGVVRGHFDYDDATRERILRQLDDGVRLPTMVGGQELALAEMLTGYGVAESVLAYYEHQGVPIAGQRILVEGFGDVGGAVAYYLHEAGARVVGAISRLPSGVYRWAVDPAGLDIPNLLPHRDGDQRSLLPAGSPEGEDPTPFWQTQADVFIPAATSYTIDYNRLDQLEKAGVRVISCGANTPFNDRDRGVHEVQKAADGRFAVIPDFIANCGMARLFAYLMHDGATVDEESMKGDISRTVRTAMARLFDGFKGETGLLEHGLRLYVP